MKQKTSCVLAVALLVMIMCGCNGAGTLRVYEKHVPVPGYSWDYNFHPSFEVNITDTAARYDIEITVRHTNEYIFSNLWLLVTANYSGEKPQSKRVELPLADGEGRWLGNGMDDIFEHRIPIQHRARFDKKGMYHFSFEQNMRINPLPHIMAVGLRIEKISP